MIGVVSLRNIYTMSFVCTNTVNFNLREKQKYFHDFALLNFPLSILFLFFFLTFLLCSSQRIKNASRVV